MLSPRTPPRRVAPAQVTSLQCNCKAGFCLHADCMECRQCCTAHNSRMKYGKERRGVGRPKKDDERKKPQLSATNAGRADAYAREARVEINYAGLMAPLTTPKKHAPPSLAKILAFFGYESETAAQICKHLPPRNMRCSPSFWRQEPEEDASVVSQRMAAMRVYRELLFSIATTVCGADDAAAASIETFSMWLNPDPAQPLHQAVARSCLRAIATAKKGSTERRLVRATLCGTFQLKDLNSLAADMPESKIGHTTYASSREDFHRLLQGDQLPKVVWSRKKFDEEVASRAIQFILAYENVAYLSWGTKKILLHGSSHDVPSILRKKPTSVIYDQYVARYESPRISRPSFFRVCATLTNGEMQPRKCVDYVSGFLVYDTFDTLGGILAQVAPTVARAVNAKLDIVQAWLKYGHGHRRGSVDHTVGCPRHDVVFALSTPDKTQPTQPRQVFCPQCVSLHRIFAYVLQLVRSAGVHESTLQVIHDIKHKINLFMGHRLRVINQQREIASMIEFARNECQRNGSTDLAVVLVDFKMKAEPMYYREKTADHYGKRGMSWHGVLIRSWEMYRESADTEPFLRETIVYYDQLSSTDNKQDKGAVLSLLEATMMALRRHMPNVKRVVFQSDNASCYQNSAIIIMLPILGHHHGVRVERYEHTDTQDGKSPLDGHFGQAQRKVRRFVKQGNNCVTPTQYVIALGADGGLPNCVAELVQYDRAAIQCLQEQISTLEVALSQLVKRPNDVLYEFPDQPVCGSAFQIRSCPDFRIRVFSYSAIGVGVLIKVSPRNGTCTRLENGGELEDARLPASDEGEGNEDEAIGRSTTHPFDAPSERDDGNEAGRELDEDVEETSSAHLANPTGPVTGVLIVKTAQLIRRARKWKFGQNAIRSFQMQKQEVGPEDRDLVAFAKTRLLSLCGSAEVGVTDAGDIDNKMMSISDGFPESADEEPLPYLDEGWARRPPNGHMYGAKYIHLYQDEVRRMFEEGASNSGDKLGAGRMLEQLRSQNEGRFNLPSEAEIRAEISRLFTQAKKRRVTGDVEGAPHSKRQKMSHEHAAYLEVLVDSNPAIMPVAALSSFRVQFPDSTSLLTDLQIRSKTSDELPAAVPTYTHDNRTQQQQQQTQHSDSKRNTQRSNNCMKRHARQPHAATPTPARSDYNADTQKLEHTAKRLQQQHGAQRKEQQHAATATATATRSDSNSNTQRKQQHHAAPATTEGTQRHQHRSTATATASTQRHKHTATIRKERRQQQHAETRTSTRGGSSSNRQRSDRNTQRGAINNREHAAPTARSGANSTQRRQQPVRRYHAAATRFVQIREVELKISNERLS